jgi:hypothetical protein
MESGRKVTFVTGRQIRIREAKNGMRKKGKKRGKSRECILHNKK